MQVANFENNDTSLLVNISSSTSNCRVGSSATKELNCGQSIQPSDITEVLRKYGNNIGPFAPFSVSLLESNTFNIFAPFPLSSDTM